MSRIGIMGITFNPIHTGHLIIAQQALTLLKLDKIWFMPAGDPPHKNNRILDKDSRKRMVELAIQNNPDFELFTYELEKERPSYSAITMTELDKLYPEHEFFFIMGADSLINFDKWYHPEVICAHTALVCADRNNIPDDKLEMVKKQLEDSYGARIYLVDTPQLEISSSDIRKRLADEPASARYIVPEAVYEYIVENRLYM